jgi:3-deoxy-manno-octulosonate cytidylyltransferase (CMP-KDO synthetase)
MIQHVWERCCATGLPVVVATDDARIEAACLGFGAQVALTSPEASCGTDRLAELANKAPWNEFDAFVNVQGDEPLVRGEDILKVVELLADPAAPAVTTLCHPVSAAEAASPDTVKVVRGAQGQCLYFSRAPIPFERDGACDAPYWKHIGLYGYTREVLARWPALPAGELEQREKLEQLRLLEAGYSIFAATTTPTGPGVDTPETLQAVRALMANSPNPACKEEPVHPPASQTRALAAVRMLVLDVDGVLTDGRLLVSAAGGIAKAFHTRDGLGVRLLQAAGIAVAVISARPDTATRTRLAELGVPVALQRLGATDKAQALRELSACAGVALPTIAFVGDDLIDLPAMALAGVSAAPADAHETVRARAQVQLSARGGHGAVREFAEQLLHAQGHGQALTETGAFLQLLARVDGSDTNQ